MQEISTPFHSVLRRAFTAQSNHVRPYMSQIGLSPGQPKVLSYLATHDGCMQKELAAACEIEPATVSKVLGIMETDGLVIRSGVPGNRRAGSVWITEKGLKANLLMQKHFETVEEQELTGFTDQEIKQFTQYLCKLYSNLTGRTID